MGDRRLSLIALLALATPAAAYTLTGTFWTWQDHPVEDPFAIAVSSFPADAGSAAEIETTFTTAMDAWNDVGLDVQLQPGDTSATASLAADGFPIIQYGSYPGLGSVLAFAASWAYDDGALFDCDLYVLDANDYGTIYWDADPAGPASGRYDLQSVATHELGHCLGLDHSADASAVMYAYYGGLRTLAADDLAGLDALYASGRCADADGDGVTDCDGDCDDANALVHPGAAEVCDGADGDCDGVIDADATETAALGTGFRVLDTAWTAAGNVFRVDAPTALVSVTQSLQTAEGTRLVWTIQTSADAGATWTVVRTDLAYATADATQTSPSFHLPLTVGDQYVVTAGAYANTMAMNWDASPDLGATGLVTPLGGVYGRPMADDLTAPDPTYLFEQSLVLVAAADPDGDGQTALCGDCAPDDATRYVDAPEACDGADQDCDDEVDEGFADTDADGVLDCLDPCPYDPVDACDDPIDTAPDDTALDTDDTDDTAPPDTDGEDTATPVPEEEDPASCGCASGGAGGIVAIATVLAGLFTRRRRSPPSTGALSPSARRRWPKAG